MWWKGLSHKVNTQASLSYEIDIKGLQCPPHSQTRPLKLARGVTQCFHTFFRPKHIHLERLHYTLSTELTMLQSNMTYLYRKRGPQSYWVVELFRCLKLPVYNGAHRALEEFNELRMESSEYAKTEKSKERRITLKVKRTMDAQPP